MNWRVLTVFSVMLNLGLALALLSSSRTGAPSASGWRQTAGGGRREPVPDAPGATAGSVKSNIAPFDWSQVASSDLRTYRDNLRAIGCPEATVRDILISVVEADYRERVRALIRPLAARFWDTVAWVLGDEKRGDEVTAKLMQLDTEKDRQLEELFGSNRGQPDGPAYTRDARQRQLLGFLPEDKQRQYAELQNRFAERLRERPLTPEGNERPWTSEETQALQREKRGALRSLMTDAEWAEYQLRISSHSRRLTQLTGIDLSEDDLKALTHIRIQADEARAALPAAPPYLSEAMMRRYGLIESRDPQAVAETRQNEARREAIARQAEDQIRSCLGEERYAQFQRAQNSDYQQLRRVTDRYGLPESLAAEVQGLTRIVRGQLETVRNQSGWTDEQRAAALAGVQAETERTLCQAMGTEVFDTYLRYGGQWIQEIGAAGAPSSD